MDTIDKLLNQINDYRKIIGYNQLSFFEIQALNSKMDDAIFELYQIIKNNHYIADSLYVMLSNPDFNIFAFRDQQLFLIMVKRCQLYKYRIYQICNMDIGGSPNHLTFKGHSEDFSSESEVYNRVMECGNHDSWEILLSVDAENKTDRYHFPTDLYNYEMISASVDMCNQSMVGMTEHFVSRRERQYQFVLTELYLEESKFTLSRYHF